MQRVFRSLARDCGDRATRLGRMHAREVMSTPVYTAQVGHWSEMLVDEAAREIGGNPNRELLVELLERAGRELEVLAGRTFGPLRQQTSKFEPNGLPFVDVPEIHVGSIDSVTEVWAVPNPVTPEVASVLQLAPWTSPFPLAAPTADGLWFAGMLLAEASRAGQLSRDHVLRWLGAWDPMDRKALMRRAADPNVRVSVPILACSVNGWWIQIARRLVWVTNETEDEGRLLEILLDESATGGDAFPLAALEPILIAVPMTTQPSEWAFIARIWTEGVGLRVDHPWARIAEAVHEHGMPTIALDTASTPFETACQLVLKAYWHGYIGGDEPALANAIALAYPRQVAQIQRQTRSPDRAAAAAVLLEQLFRPGFDPAQGAEATRRYVRRKASIAVLQHRKAESPERYPWTQVGVSERRYYKLLPRFAQKVDGRYDVDQGDIVRQMRAYLNERDRVTAVHTAAMDLLRSRGFTHAAARKWLQRHDLAEAVDAWPRSSRETTNE